MTRSTRAQVTLAQELEITVADEIAESLEYDYDYDYDYNHYSYWDLYQESQYFNDDEGFYCEPDWDWDL